MILCLKLWTSVLLGLLISSYQCEARAVNISNTWTMPAEGLNVFYRFFRDKISWFEADAVCQFHHANLVTVDNSFQFDATRDLLRELEVNDIVWIGLMRPQSSERFMWSTSHALAPETGYWAESLPLMDSPLCAVIDPVRDYRWHALRCGGPETASFMCEMNVPSWAEACILKDTPSLTIQYMADTASIELIRDCGEEGLIRQMCRGKQDREQIMRELVCKSERDQLKKLFSPLANTHFKSLEIIKSVRTDNNEDNAITEAKAKEYTTTAKPIDKNAVQQLIETFNVEEIMQADNDPAPQPEFHIPGEIPKPVKKISKKVKPTETDKKEKAPKKTMEKEIPLEDMMMGDQPIEDVANEIDVPLPHIKKAFPQDLTHLHQKILQFESKEKETLLTTPLVDTTTTTTTTTTPVPTTAVDIKTTVTTTTTSQPVFTTTAEVVATVGHPVHPQQKSAPAMPEHPHFIKETNDNHFIPPMLMVKSHYQAPKSHEHHDTTTHAVHHEVPTSSPVSVNKTTSQPIPLATETVSVSTKIVEATTATTTPRPTDTTAAPTPEVSSVTTKLAQSTWTPEPDATITPVQTETTLIVVSTTEKSAQPTTQSPTSPSSTHPSSTAAPTTTTHSIPTSDDIVTTQKENIFASNKDSYQPYKPNRRRSLTKPETRSYFKKVLG